MKAKILSIFVCLILSTHALWGISKDKWRLLEESGDKNKISSFLSLKCIETFFREDNQSGKEVLATSKEIPVQATCLIQSNFVPSERFQARLKSLFKAVRLEYVRDTCVLWMDLATTTSEDFSFVDFFTSAGQHTFYVKGKFPKPHSFIKATGDFYYSEDSQGIYLKIPIVNKATSEAFSFEVWMKKKLTSTWEDAIQLKKKATLEHLNIFLPYCAFCSESEFSEILPFKMIYGIAENEPLLLENCSERTNFRLSPDGIFFSTDFKARLVGIGGAQESGRTVFVNRPFKFLLSSEKTWRYLGVIQAPCTPKEE